MTAPTPSRTVPGLSAIARQGEKIAMLTCYDASFAALLDRAGVDALLVGDSLGMVIGGHHTTLSVTSDEMVYHTRCVPAGPRPPLVIPVMPFGSYYSSPEQAYGTAVRLLAAGPKTVKVKGGSW